MKLGWARRWALAGVASLTSCGGCESEPRHRPESLGAAPQSLALSRPPPARAYVVEDADPPPKREQPESARSHDSNPAETFAAEAALDATEVGGTVSEAFVIDSLVDVAAAGPATATEHGIAMIDRDNRLQLAALGGGALDGRNKPRQTAITSLPASAGPFTLARGPAVRGRHAYWVSRGRVLRQSLSTAHSGVEPFIVADDARVGTRVAVPVGSSGYLQRLPELAAYIARPKDPEAPPTARLWVLGQAERLLLTNDTSSAHSVALVASADGLAVFFLEARTGMSSIHVRSIQFSKAQAPSLGEDRIAWVGGPGRPTTELFSVGDEAPLVTSFMTLERDATHFGLVELGISLAEAALPVEPEWLLYANGIEPAPLALAKLCGRTVVALARPSSAVPHASQELVLLGRDGDRWQQAVIVARSRAFFDVSLVSLGRGALLSYVSDHRTWARTIRCLL